MSRPSLRKKEDSPGQKVLHLEGVDPLKKRAEHIAKKLNETQSSLYKMQIQLSELQKMYAQELGECERNLSLANILRMTEDDDEEWEREKEKVKWEVKKAMYERFIKNLQEVIDLKELSDPRKVALETQEHKLVEGIVEKKDLHKEGPEEAVKEEKLEEVREERPEKEKVCDTEEGKDKNKANEKEKEIQEELMQEQQTDKMEREKKREKTEHDVLKPVQEQNKIVRLSEMQAHEVLQKEPIEDTAKKVTPDTAKREGEVMNLTPLERIKEEFLETERNYVSGLTIIAKARFFVSFFFPFLI